MSLPCLMVHPYIYISPYGKFRYKCLIKSPVITSTTAHKKNGGPASLWLLASLRRSIITARAMCRVGARILWLWARLGLGFGVQFSDVGWLMLSHSLRSALPLKTKYWSMSTIFEVATWRLRLFPIKTYLCRCSFHVYPLEVQHGTVRPAMLGPDVILWVGDQLLAPPFMAKSLPSGFFQRG